jgi:hypothetical protein
MMLWFLVFVDTKKPRASDSPMSAGKSNYFLLKRLDITKATDDK